MRRLAQEGFRVCVNDVGANQAGIDKLVSELNSKHGDNTAIGVVADVTSSAEVKKMVEESVEKLGPLTVMVANAGIAQVTPVLEISEEDVQKMFNVNFMGVWHWSVLSLPVQAMFLEQRVRLERIEQACGHRFGPPKILIEAH